jgi:hypothetical protein
LSLNWELNVMSKITKEKFLALLKESVKMSNNCMYADATKGDYYGSSLTMMSEAGVMTFGVVHSQDGNGARIFNKNMDTMMVVDEPILLKDFKAIQKLMLKINKQISTLT